MNKHNITISQHYFFVDCEESTAVHFMSYSPKMGTCSVTYKSNTDVAYVLEVSTEEFFTALLENESLGRAARALQEASASTWKVHYMTGGPQATRVK